MILPDTYSPDEQVEILRQFQNLLDSWTTRKNPQDVEMVTQAFMLAVEAHKDARRRSGEPYIFHPIAVATIIAKEMGMGRTSIMCALLHDVVEDTSYTLDDMRERFGERVAKVIDGVTKLNKMDFQTDVESLQAENFRKIIITMSDEIRVIIVKLADRLHNMRTLASMPHHKQLKIASETSFLYAPLAYRLGLYAIKMELGDLVLKYINPQIYDSIRKQLDAIHDAKMQEMNDFIAPVMSDFEKKGMKVRSKVLERTVSGVWERMQKFEQSLDEIYDVYVVRFIIDCQEDVEKIECWKTFAILTEHYRPNNAKLRDWISFPKTNGYESIHAVFMGKAGNWVETQIRTERMEDIAERGFSAYWKHRNSKNISAESGLELWLNRIKSLVNSESSSAIDFVNSFKLDLFNDEIFVFTPKGDMICLPKDSTVLDFAYAIHTELGNHCIGANINKKLVKLDYVLKMGDQVEVITSEYQNPQEKWFDYLVTSAAKSRLKTGLKDFRKTFKEEGKKKLGEMFKKLGVEFSKQNRNIIVEKEHLASRADLYYYVAINKIRFQDVEPVFKKESGFFSSLLKFPTWGSSNKNGKKPDGSDIENSDYIISTCCNPIPGDDVVAITFPNEPVQIHRPDCPVAIKLMARYGQNIVKAKWQFKDNFAFLATMKIVGVDKMGFGSKIFEVISNDMKLNIQSLEIHSEGGMVEAIVSVYVNNLKNLEDLIDKIKKIDLVKKVTRMERASGN